MTLARQAHFGQLPGRLEALRHGQDCIARHKAPARKLGSQVLAKPPSQAGHLDRHHFRQRTARLPSQPVQVRIGAERHDGRQRGFQLGTRLSLAQHEHGLSLHGQPADAWGHGAGQIICGDAGKRQEAAGFGDLRLQQSPHLGPMQRQFVHGHGFQGLVHGFRLTVDVLPLIKRRT